MKRLLIYNYWLIIVSWCLFLNDLTLLAILTSFAACALMVLINREINYWRMCFLSVFSYVTVSFFLSMSNIPYFFEKIYLFLAVISIDLALTSERLYLFKSKYLKPFLVCMLISVSVLSIIVVILPNSLYTIFTKDSLFIMIGLMFLPYLITLAICICYKDYKKVIKNKRKAKILQRSKAF